MKTIIEALRESKTTGPELIAEAEALLAQSKLKLPKDVTGAPALFISRIAAQVPEATWLAAGETAGKKVEREDAVGKWTTKVTCFYDHEHNAVVEHHVRGVETDYDHKSWANSKRFATAAKADVQWARYGKKYRFDDASKEAAAAKKKK